MELSKTPKLPPSYSYIYIYTHTHLHSYVKKKALNITCGIPKHGRIFGHANIHVIFRDTPVQGTDMYP